MDTIQPLISQIEQQQQLSEQAGEAVLCAIKSVYFPTTPKDKILFGEIGSYGRGTNTDPTPDIDLMFLGIPTSVNGPWMDWSETDTYAMVANHTGITEIAKLWTMDPKLVEAIGETRKLLDETFHSQGETRFNWVRSWSVFPGVVFNVSAFISDYGGVLEFDINLYHPIEYFGVEHGKRFKQYYRRVRQELGDDRAVQLIFDIRQLKERAKKGARIPITKSLDRSKKVPGIIPECLFTSMYPPPTFGELQEHFKNFPTSTLPQPDPDSDYTQHTQIVNSGMSPMEAIHSFRKEGVLSDGGWKNLRTALR